MLTSAPCEHLEAILPNDDSGTRYWGKDNQKTMRIIYTDDLDKFAKYAQDMFEGLKDEELVDFVKRLYGWGLNKESVDIMTDRFVLGKTFNEISNERGYNNVVAVHRLYKKGLEVIRQAVVNSTSGAV